MDPRPALSTYAVLAARVRGAPARLGDVRLVCIDGPAGSGKTTFAGRLAATLGSAATLVHLEDLYAGWTLTGAVARLSAAVLRPLAEGRSGSYRRYDWHAARFSPEQVVVAPVPVLVVEGCGSAPRALHPWTTLLVWIEAPEPLRTERGLVRDGAHTAPEWTRWQRTEAVEFAAEDPRSRADLRVDGAAIGTAAQFRLLP